MSDRGAKDPIGLRATRLNRMIEDLLDMGKTEFRFVPTDINHLAATLILERKPEALERGLTLLQELQSKW